MSEKKTIQFKIPEHLHEVRLDRALSEVPEIGTRSRAERLIELGCVKATKTKKIKPSLKVHAGDVFQIEIPEISSNLVSYDFPLEILFEDEFLVVINKPAGLVVHPAEGHYNDTLVNALLQGGRSLSIGFHENRPGIVHRLDRDTSGVLVVAKNDLSQQSLSQQFKERSVKRTYWAVVFGIPHPGSGKIETHLGRHPAHRKRFATVESGGKLAITKYETIKTWKNELSLLRVTLETGRTHQIRVHLSELGNPIVGDELYKKGHPLRLIESDGLKKLVTSLDRFVLHAASLGFVHPKSGKELVFQAPWPQELRPLVDYCGFPDGF